MIDSARAAGPGPSEARPLFVVAFWPSLVTIATAFALSAVVLLSSSTPLGALIPTVAGIWLAVHQVPVTISDITLGVLPLLPTALLVAGVARVVRRVGGEGRPPAALRSLLLCAIAGPAFFTAMALAVINDAAGRYTIGTPAPLTAFLCTVAVHLCAVLLGLAPAYWRDAAQALRLPAWVDDCVRLAGRALLLLGAAGLAIVLVRLLLRWETVLELIRSGNDGAGMLALVVLSLLYLPNAVIAAAALPLGAVVHLGPISTSVFAATPGRAPGVPILAVLPQGPAPWYLLGLLAVAAFAAVQVGRRCAAHSLDLGPTVTVVATTALLTAAGAAAASFLAGGELGGFGHAGTDPLQVFGFTLGWIALVGVLTALLLQQFGESRAVRAVLREQQDAPSGYTTFADEADDADEGVTVEIEPADREAVEVVDDVPADAQGDEQVDERGGGPEAVDDGNEPETGDFDAVARQPTVEVRPARRPAPRPVTPRPAATKRERNIADIEELDSYTFGQ